MSDQPRTAAGRALLANLRGVPVMDSQIDLAKKGILAIEAEAASSGYQQRKDFYLEAQARPAVASEGLRAALDWLDGIGPLHRAAVTKIRAALASDAGSVEALDVVNVASVAMSKGEREGIAECIRYIDLKLEDWREHHDVIGPTVVNVLETLRRAIEIDAHLSGATRILLERDAERQGEQA